MVWEYDRAAFELEDCFRIKRDNLSPNDPGDEVRANAVTASRACTSNGKRASLGCGSHSALPNLASNTHYLRMLMIVREKMNESSAILRNDCSIVNEGTISCLTLNESIHNCT